DGVVRANGQSASRGGAGGTINVLAAELAGGGTLEVKGGNGSGAGGGGAIAIEYGALAGSDRLLDRLVVNGGGSGTSAGGAGTAYVKGPSESLGRLLVDNAGITGTHQTVLPSLGSGTVLEADGTWVLTDREEPIPRYLAGH